MKKFNFSALFLLLLLTACTSAPWKTTAGQDSEHPALDLETMLPASADAGNQQSYPKMELSGQMLYTFLLADIAAQRGQLELASQAYLELAKTTRDLRVVRRSAQLAYESHQVEPTLEAFNLWHELEPNAPMPRQMLATVLLSRGRMEEARPFLVGLLAANSNDVGRTFLQFYPLFGRYADKQAIYKMLLELAQPYPRVAEVHLVLAQAARAANLEADALREVHEARALRKDWDAPVILEVQLLQTKKPAEALAVIKSFLKEYPEAHEARLFYARNLLEGKQYQESRLQFQQLLKAKPDNAELAFAIALLSIQLGELDRAETELNATLKAGKKNSATVHYYLGQLQEAKKHDVGAMQEYQQVMDGEYLFPARMRISYLLVKANRLDEAREMLHKTQAKNNQQQVQLILTEGQVLRDAKFFDKAFQVLTRGLDKFPNHPDLMYETAMMADKLGKASLFEDLLRKLIKAEPGHAHAYNALGYSLLDRKVRLEEAMKLVEKAHELAPEDAAIMDSMGWGYYLTGNLSKSVEFMRRAYAVYPDPEVAAHLGEVLWQQGSRDEASAIWQENLKKNPDNTVLKAVIKKFLP
jgi:tetratricopeptide (TPR) repeat protein